MKRLQSKGLGSQRRQAEPISYEEEELMWEKKILGDDTPESLLNTIIYMNGLYFALRSGQEHRNLSAKFRWWREQVRDHILFTLRTSPKTIQEVSRAEN